MNLNKLSNIFNRTIFNIGRLTHRIVSLFKSGYNYDNEKDATSNKNTNWHMEKINNNL